MEQHSPFVPAKAGTQGQAFASKTGLPLPRERTEEYAGML